MGLFEHLHVRLAVLTCSIKHDIMDLHGNLSHTCPDARATCHVQIEMNITKNSQSPFSRQSAPQRYQKDLGFVFNWLKSNFVCEENFFFRSTAWSTRAAPDPSTPPSLFPSQTTTEESCGKLLPAHFLTPGSQAPAQKNFYTFIFVLCPSERFF